jgi:excisionase family DNA binding protein
MSADRVALEGLRLLIREVVHEVLREERPSSPAAAEGFIGCPEAARRVGVKPATVRTWIKAGTLAATQVPGVRGWKIRPADLDSFMQGGTTSVLPPVNLGDERARRLAASIRRGERK